MLYIIGKNKEIEDVIENTNFSSVNIWERKHLQNWICQKPEILGEELLIVTTEYEKFDKVNDRLDILAIDRNGKIVLIELKRDVASKFTDLQAIHYASYCSTLVKKNIIEMMIDYYNKNNLEISDDVEEEIMNFIQNEEFEDFDNKPRILLVANDFKERTLSAVNWLREFGIDITCIRLECYKISDNLVIKPEVIFPLPELKDYIVSVEQKRKETETLTLRQREYQDFWRKIIDKFNERKPDIINKSLNTGNYFNISTGIKNVHFEWWIRKIKSPMGFLIALHFEKSNFEENKKLFNYFLNQKEEIQKEFKNEIQFQKKWCKNWSQIYILNKNTDLNEDNINWGVNMMVKFYEVFKPHLDKFS